MNAPLSPALLNNTSPAHGKPQALLGLRLIIADDHALVRMGYRLLLEGAGAQVIAEADSAEAALQEWFEHRPDLLVMDVAMPGLGGLAGLEHLLHKAASARVLMVSAHADAQIPQRALRAGAQGYLCKRSAPDEFLRAVEACGAGRRYIDPGVAATLALAQLNPAGNLESLSEREFSVFMQLAKGRSVNDVAEDFHLSPSTVGTHLYRIKQKLEVRNSAEMTLLALRQGLLDAAAMES